MKVFCFKNEESFVPNEEPFLVGLSVLVGDLIMWYDGLPATFVWHLSCI